MKKIEDTSATMKMYDRIGRNCKTLLQERDAARKQTNVVNKRKYAISNSKAGYIIDYSMV
jgi:hypothetical protein